MNNCIKGGVSNYGFHCQRSNGRPEECICCIKLIIIKFQNYSNVHKCLANTPPFLILILYTPPHIQLISFLSPGPPSIYLLPAIPFLLSDHLLIFHLMIALLYKARFMKNVFTIYIYLVHIHTWASRT